LIEHYKPHIKAEKGVNSDVPNGYVDPAPL
jgi:hypothetical protein